MPYWLLRISSLLSSFLFKKPESHTSDKKLPAPSLFANDVCLDSGLRLISGHTSYTANLKPQQHA